jgi:hemin uptake protein HemP
MHSSLAGVDWRIRIIIICTNSFRHGTPTMPAADCAPVSHPSPTPAVAVGARATVAVLDSRRLLNGAREVVIAHGGALYRLRHTRNDKLILVK